MGWYFQREAELSFIAYMRSRKLQKVSNGIEDVDRFFMEWSWLAREGLEILFPCVLALCIPALTRSTESEGEILPEPNG